MTLGEKIKTLRISKRMTQSQLSGDKITRNMLSRIECDKANPSLDTLKYISEGLEVPLSYLFSDEDDLFFLQKKSYINEIYLAYQGKAYKACIKLINRIDSKDNELYFILASSHFELAKASLFKGGLLSAIENFDLSLEYSKKTALDTNHFTAIIPMYRAIAKNIQAPLLEFDIDAYHDGLYASFDYEFFKYLTLDFEYPYTTPIYRGHIKAKQLIKERNYEEAIKILNELSETNNQRYNAFAIFGIYSDLETCYKQLYDFENAYRYSTKRLSLLEGFKS